MRNIHKRKSILKAENMHRTYEIDIKPVLVSGENSINIIFRSPVEYGRNKNKELFLESSQDAIPGISHIRKAHCMSGWDWGPKLPDMGIWKDISIICYDYGRIDDVYITQFHSEDKVNLDVRVKIEKLQEFEHTVEVSVETPEGKIISKKVIDNINEHHISLDINNPKLWWPNNFGDQPLYKINISLIKESSVLDNKSLKIGLRTIKVNRQKDQWGESFEFQVNGNSIFSMGADYIPEDNLLARCSRERTEKLIKSCIAANFNTIRVWGGGYYPNDYFYDLCDEYGLIVWQDHLYACGVYDFNDDFKENIRQETIDNVKRLRHHASLGLWCGNNEME